MYSNLLSYFEPPIAPYRRDDGSWVNASTFPSSSVSVEQLYRMIVDSGNELAKLSAAVRSSDDLKRDKTRLLPYVTPYGIFERRQSGSVLTYSGLIPIDIDHLGSEDEACRLRDWIFSNPYLDARLVFVSPSGYGVKAFISYGSSYDGDKVLTPDQIVERKLLAQDFIRLLCDYDLTGKIDDSGKDMARACFLCHDSNAKFRFN